MIRRPLVSLVPVRALGALAAIALLAAAPAAAEIYKCQGPDGSVVYTTDDSKCPGAAAHELKGEVLTVPSASGTAPSPPRRSLPAAASDDQAQRANWQSKRRAAQARLEEATARRRYVESAVRACNRGAELWIEDAAGVRRSYKCEDVDAEYAELTAEVARLEHYLAEGLEDECRRAGCLPGWVR